MSDANPHTLSYPTVVAGAVAAATATALSYQLGLVGTILGAWSGPLFAQAAPETTPATTATRHRF